MQEFSDAQAKSCAKKAPSDGTDCEESTLGRDRYATLNPLTRRRPELDFAGI